MLGSSRTIELSTETFASVLGHPHVLVSWNSRSSIAWRTFATVYERAAQRHQDVVFGVVDIDREPELTSACIIRSIPTLTAFRRCRLVLVRTGFEIDESIDAVVRSLKQCDVPSRAQRRTR